MRTQNRFLVSALCVFSIFFCITIDSSAYYLETEATYIGGFGFFKDAQADSGGVIDSEVMNGDPVLPLGYASARAEEDLFSSTKVSIDQGSVYEVSQYQAVARSWQDFTLLAEDDRWDFVIDGVSMGIAPYTVNVANYSISISVWNDFGVLTNHWWVSEEIRGQNEGPGADTILHSQNGSNDAYTESAYYEEGSLYGYRLLYYTNSIPLGLYFNPGDNFSIHTEISVLAWGTHSSAYAQIGTPPANSGLYGVLVRGGTSPVPEPTTVLLLGSGLVGLAGFRRKFRKR